MQRPLRAVTWRGGKPRLVLFHPVRVTAHQDPIVTTSTRPPVKVSQAFGRPRWLRELLAGRV